jgi:hypothetical protein
MRMKLKEASCRRERGVGSGLSKTAEDGQNGDDPFPGNRAQLVKLNCGFRWDQR